MRTLKFYISKNHPDYNIVKQHSIQARRLFNTLNKLQYEKQDYLKDNTINTPVSNGLKVNILKDNVEKKRKIIHKELNIELPQKVSQSISRDFKTVWDNIIKKRMKGQVAGDIRYKKQFSKIIYNTQAISRKNGLNNIIPSGWSTGFKLPNHILLSQVKSAEVKTTPDGFLLIVNYTNNNENTIINDSNIIAAGDLGIDNLITIITTNNSRPKNVNGKLLKSKNRYYNKKIAKLRSKKSSCKDSYNKNIIQKNIDRLWFKRDKEFNHLLHSISNEVVKYLMSQKVSEFIIGWNNGFKQNINIGYKNNQSFAFMPLAKFKNMLTYKCENVGIKVIVVEESYTSKASFIDNDTLPVYDPDNNVKYVFSGYRKHRGEYVSKNGLIIHADVNAAWNIARKCKPSIGWCSGVVVTPERLKITY